MLIAGTAVLDGLGVIVEMGGCLVGTAGCG